MDIQVKPIGRVHTPYNNRWTTPYQPPETGAPEDVFYVELDTPYIEGLYRLETFSYVYLLYHLDRTDKSPSMRVKIPWAFDTTVGIFSSRSPARPNPIGLSVVRLLSKEPPRLYISAIDVFDATPLLDIKPYIRDLDSKPDANHGWLTNLPDHEHLMLHIRGIPHD